MNTIEDSIERILSTDRVWAAYALADLEPEYRQHCTWLVADSSVILVYAGLEPAVLFTFGIDREISGMMPRVPEGLYQISSRPAHLRALGGEITLQQVVKMWRMVHRREGQASDLSGVQCQRLYERDLDTIKHLFRDHTDAPDAFHASQLRSGVFYGIFDQGLLVAMSGTHVRSERYKLAAIGNVFTDPAYRGRGFASHTSQAVVQDLRSGGIETIVLNVARSNRAALKAYERIGFEPYCEHLEGYARRV